MVPAAHLHLHLYPQEDIRLHGVHVREAVLLEHRQRTGRGGYHQCFRHIVRVHRSHLRLAELRGCLRDPLRVDEPDADGRPAASFRYLRGHVHPHTIRVRQAAAGLLRPADRLHGQLLRHLRRRAVLRQPFHGPNQSIGHDGWRTGLRRPYHSDRPRDRRTLCHLSSVIGMLPDPLHPVHCLRHRDPDEPARRHRCPRYPRAEKPRRSHETRSPDEANPLHRDGAAQQLDPLRVQKVDVRPQDQRGEQEEGVNS